MYVEARSHILFDEFSKTDTYSLRKMVVVSCCKYFFFVFLSLSFSLFSNHCPENGMKSTEHYGMCLHLLIINECCTHVFIENLCSNINVWSIISDIFSHNWSQRLSNQIEHTKDTTNGNGCTGFTSSRFVFHIRYKPALARQTTRHIDAICLNS